MDYEAVEISTLDAVETLKDSAEFLVEQDGISKKASFKQINDAISVGSSEVYSTDEVCIGTWIDGKPMYRMVIETTLPSKVDTNVVIATVDDDKFVYRISGMWQYNTRQSKPLNAINPNNEDYSNYSWVFYKRGELYATIGSELLNKQCWIVLEYTKTTD